MNLVFSSMYQCSTLSFYYKYYEMTLTSMIVPDLFNELYIHETTVFRIGSLVGCFKRVLLYFGVNLPAVNIWLTPCHLLLVSCCQCLNLLWRKNNTDSNWSICRSFLFDAILKYMQRQRCNSDNIICHVELFPSV